MTAVVGAGDESELPAGDPAGADPRRRRATVLIELSRAAAVVGVVAVVVTVAVGTASRDLRPRFDLVAQQSQAVVDAVRPAAPLTVTSFVRGAGGPFRPAAGEEPAVAPDGPQDAGGPACVPCAFGRGHGRGPATPGDGAGHRIPTAVAAGDPGASASPASSSATPAVTSTTPAAAPATTARPGPGNAQGKAATTPAAGASASSNGSPGTTPSTTVAGGSSTGPSAGHADKRNPNAQK